MKLKTIFEIILLLLTSSYLFSQTNPQDPTGQIEIQIGDIIQSQFGNGYDFGFDVLDSIIGKAGRYDKELVQDPYGTLNGCIIFNAGKAVEDDSGFIGILRNGQIVWYSNPIIGGSWTGVFAARDLNHDGKVEILSAFFRGSIPEVQYMWIISWDGQQGQIINQIDSASRNSTIVGSAEIFDLIEQDSIAPVKIRALWDNEEFAGYFPDERVSTYPYVTYDWNGTKYGLWPSTIQIPANTYFPANRLSVVVGCTVRKISDSLSYIYLWNNHATSQQSIARFALYGIQHNFTSYEQSGWILRGLWRDESIVEWIPLIAPLKYGVPPGHTKEGIILKSLSLPSIVKYYIQGNRPKTDVDFSTEEGRNGFKNDFFNNSIFSYTIAPKDPPSPFDNLNFLDTLKSYTAQSRTLGWITEQSTADKYTMFFDSAKAQLQRNAIRATRATLDTVLANTNHDSSGTLLSEAYALIYFNTEYLLNQLPTPPPQYNLNINTIGNGTVTKTPELSLYDSSTTVTLTANPLTGYRFGSWSGDAVGTVNPISVVMNNDKNITATFLQNTFFITATAGTNGTITPSGDVSVAYGANQSFTITPITGYHIADVIIDQTSVGAVATYNFTIVTAPHTISSTFAINTYTLAVNAINGTVSKSPDQPTYNHGTSVQLTATPNTGYSFASWSGDFVGSANPTTIIMDANKTIIANFALNPPTITSFTPANGPIGTSVTITGTNFISVTSVKFNGTIATYTVNSSTQITATVPTGATTGTITVTNTAGTATSSTTFKVGYILTIQIAGSGTVLKNPNYLSYTPGTTVTLTAKPTLIEALKIVPNTPEPISWKFDHWEIDLTGTQNPKSIIMNGNKTVKAVFIPVY